MKTKNLRLLFVMIGLSASLAVFGQSGSNSPNYFVSAVVGVSMFIGIWALITITNNLLFMEAKKVGIDTSKNDFSIIPSVDAAFRKTGNESSNAGFVRLNKGFDIKLAGKAKSVFLERGTNRIALKPTNFIGLSPIPKVEVVVGDSVKAGDVIFYDKKNPDVKFVSPVSGEVVAINRGDKRAIADIVILVDRNQSYKTFNVPSLDADRSTLVNFMMESGAWTMINQRPFDVIADANEIPSNIFISTFDSAPLAPDNNMVIQGQQDAFQKGIDVLAKLTSGQVHLGLSASAGKPFEGFTNVKKTVFSGKHPAGNVGVQIHHTAPIRGNAKVWTLGVQEVISIGNLFLTGKFDGSRVVAVTGGELSQTGYVRTYIGACVADLVAGDVKHDNVRYISGDVLSGKQVDKEGFLDFRADQLTVIKEGNEYELFGWLLPLAPRPTISGTFPNFLYPNYEFEANTNTHGEQRAFVESGQYEQVLPMDIYVQHLAKAVLAGDIEKMEGMGINELTEEDVALCEFVCTSKIPLQSIIRQGLDTMREQA